MFYLLFCTILQLGRWNWIKTKLLLRKIKITLNQSKHQIQLWTCNGKIFDWFFLTLCHVARLSHSRVYRDGHSKCDHEPVRIWMFHGATHNGSCLLWNLHYRSSLQEFGGVYSTTGTGQSSFCEIRLLFSINFNNWMPVERAADLGWNI